MCFNDEFGFISNFCSTPVCLADPTSIRLTRSVWWFPAKSYRMFTVERGTFILASAELVIASENNFARDYASPNSTHVIRLCECVELLICSSVLNLTLNT